MTRSAGVVDEVRLVFAVEGELFANMATAVMEIDVPVKNAPVVFRLIMASSYFWGGRLGPTWGAEDSEQRMETVAASHDQVAVVRALVWLEDESMPASVRPTGRVSARVLGAGPVGIAPALTKTRGMLESPDAARGSVVVGWPLGSRK